MSGNTIGATYWTDGKEDAPMLPDQPWLVQCPHCRASLWLDEQEKVGEIDTFETSEQYKDSKSCTTPNFNEYFNILSKGNLSSKKERYLRFRAMWAGNDPRRDTGLSKNDLSDEERANLEGIFKILDYSDDDDRLMMAEIKRELGKFDDAEAIINESFANEYMQAVSIIKELIEKKESFVTEMKFVN